MARVPPPVRRNQWLPRSQSRILYLPNGTELEGAGLHGCTCGAGAQLEEERQRLVAQSQGFGKRSDLVAAKEQELEHQAEDIETDFDRMELGEEELLWCKSDAGASLAEVEQRLREVMRSLEVQAQTEEEFKQQAAELKALEAEIKAGDTSVAEDESSLLDARSRIEDEAKRQDFIQHAAWRDAEEQQHELEDCGQRLDEIEREQWTLENDQRLLDEIEAQVEPIRRGLEERSQRLQAEEAELLPQEADCEEREAQLLPEHRRTAQQLVAAEARIRDLESREEESRQQQQRLLQQQRDLGGEEVHLSGLETALLKSAEPKTLEAAAKSPEEMAQKLGQLRTSQGDWAERLRLHQLEVHELEAELVRLQARKSKTLVGEVVLPSPDKSASKLN